MTLRQSELIEKHGQGRATWYMLKAEVPLTVASDCYVSHFWHAHHRLITENMPNMNLPKYSVPQRIGERGFTIVKGIVESEFGWIARKNPQEYDFGIDGYIDLITESGQVTGKSLAIQVKCGASYFGEVTENGWVYRGEMKHINYYMNLPCPMLLIIADEQTHQAWWVQFEASKTAPTDNGWKITIPKSNKLDEGAKNLLSELVGNVTDYISQFEYLWSINSLLIRENILFLVDKESIECLEIQPIVDLFEYLQSSPDLISKCRGKIEIGVYGYDDDPRELYEIPEVRKWWAMAEPIIKYWIYFLRISPDSQALKMLCFCTQDYKVEQVDKKERRKLLSLSTMDLQQFMLRHFLWLNEFCEQYEISEEVNIDISNKFIQLLSPGHPPSTIAE